MAVLGSVRAAAFDHVAWDRVLKAHVSEIGEVDYAAIQAGSKDLDIYLRQLAEASPRNRPEMFPSRAHELAYWINAYNAFVTRGVVDHWPTRSVLDLAPLKRFFWREDYTAGGVKMSLYALENDIIRGKYHEPRIHFAIVCASLSCPMLAREAFTGENLEVLLDRQARRFVQQRRSVTIDAAAGEVTLSEIFKWYKDDFGSSILDYIRRYASEEQRRAIDALKQPKIKYYDYDWSINDPGSRGRAKSAVERELAR